MTDNGLKTWVVYEKPRDFPTEFVVREWVTDSRGVVPGEIIGRAKTFGDAIKSIPDGAVQTAPFDEDDPCIRAVFL